MENVYYTDEERKKIDEDLIAQNQALSDLITNQQKEEQAIKDNYDSFGSRLTRALEVFGAGMRGENVAPILQNQRSRLDNQLKQAQERYKSNRDTSNQRIKDLLARKDAIAKFDYDRDKNNELLKLEKDKLDWQKTKDNLDRLNAERKDNLDRLNAQRTEIEALNQEATELANIEKDIAGLRNNINPKDIYTRDPERISSARINKINLDIVKNKYGLVGDKAVSFIKENPNLFPSDRDSADVVFKKYNNLGYGLASGSDSTNSDPESTVEPTDTEQKKLALLSELDRLSGSRSRTEQLLKNYGSAQKVKEYLESTEGKKYLNEARAKDIEKARRYTAFRGAKL